MSADLPYCTACSHSYKHHGEFVEASHTGNVGWATRWQNGRCMHADKALLLVCSCPKFTRTASEKGET